MPATKLQCWTRYNNAGKRYVNCVDKPMKIKAKLRKPAAAPKIRAKLRAAPAARPKIRAKLRAKPNTAEAKLKKIRAVLRK